MPDPADRRAAVVAVLGATGRLGRAIGRRASQSPDHAASIRGLARHAPTESAPWARFIAADRHDADAVRRLIDGADVIIDLCAFDAGDADALLEAWRLCIQPPRGLVFASSLAARPRDRWGSPVSNGPGGSSPQAPSGGALDPVDGVDLDSYGAGKRAARLRYERALSVLGVNVTTLLLPQVLALDDLSPRELRYLTDAQAHGVAFVPGSGAQRPCVVRAMDAAESAWLCALRSRASLGGEHVSARQTPGGQANGAQVGELRTFQVAPPTQPDVATLVRALLDGAGLSPVVQPHPDPSWRGPHSGADEWVDGSALRAWLPELKFGDVVLGYGALGRRLASTST